MGVVIDTSALIALERADGLDALPEDLVDQMAVMPAIVYAELHVGAHLAGDDRRGDQRRTRIAALASRVPVVEFDRAIAERWAALFADLTRAGTMIPANDLQVAATARHLDFDVLLGPRGDAHFSKIPSLGVVRLPGGR